MPNNQPRVPVIVDFYLRYLDDQDSAAFIKNIARRYTCASLERLAVCGDRSGRRAAVLALGYMGDFSSNAVMGQALVDRDRGVRTIAENGIRDLWRRVGSREQRATLSAIIRLNQTKQYDEAIRLATELIHESPWIAEAWSQRGAAYFHLSQYDSSIRDCHQALEINPYHFTAAAGMGQCHLLQENPVAALEAYRRALRLNPGMEEVRVQVIQLQRTMKGE
ncbi:Tetratricopeptide repeat protein [Posidoniimonas corsicana]|uniref:Tetratricopeptide repeat protein n=1 Tax=Posidoniimonas corsicana TaxID=1938618 RepID=A0A5C5VIQ2_9BACT|nr:tetratricopeptide repeat protein [Posidoniimonas corsicana]TWT37847.1 Tetratricopeptide repeat protein [Posidoniimonas corsicana]